MSIELIINVIINSIKSCKMTSGSKTISLITNKAVESVFGGYITILTERRNGQAAFDFNVFQIGNESSGTVFEKDIF